MKNKKILLVGRGKISGTYCDSFWCFYEDGTLVVSGRKPTPVEQKQILIDIERHKDVLAKELSDLNKVKSLIVNCTK